MDKAGGVGELFPKGAIVRPDAEEPQLRAEVGISLQAGLAGSAWDRRIDGGELSFLQMGYTLADCCDDAGGFVTEDERGAEGSVSNPAMGVDVDVGGAHPDGANADDDFPGPGDRVGVIVPAEGSRGGQAKCTHGHAIPCGMGW
jgi:hypothetical protein